MTTKYQSMKLFLLFFDFYTSQKWIRILQCSLGNWNCDTSILHLLSFPSFLQTTMYNQLELCKYESFTKQPLNFFLTIERQFQPITKNCNPWKKAADILIVFHGSKTVFRMDVTAWMNKGMWMYKFVYCT